MWNPQGAVVGIERSIGAHQAQGWCEKKTCHPRCEGRVALPSAHLLMASNTLRGRHKALNRFLGAKCASSIGDSPKSHSEPQSTSQSHCNSCAALCWVNGSVNSSPSPPITSMKAAFCMHVTVVRICKPNSITFPHRAGDTHATFLRKLFGM